MKPQSRCVSLSHHAFHLIYYIRVEGKKINYLLLVFQEEIVVSYFPSFHYNIMMVFEQLLRFWIVAHIMESSHRQQSGLGGIFRHSIGEEVVPSCVADVKILVFICKTHRHSLAVVLPCPCIDMSELQDVVTHPAFISNEYHSVGYIQ